MNPEIYGWLGGAVLGLLAGVAIGVNLWHVVCTRRGWYGKEGV